MQFIANKQKLISAIQTIHGAIGTRVAMPILANILLELNSNTLKLTATNLDLSITSTFEVTPKEDGATTVPAEKFYNIISSLPEDEINIEVTNKDLVKVTTSSCKFKIMGIPKDEYPKLPDFEQNSVLRLDNAILSEMLQLVMFSASTDETKYVQNSVLFKLSKDKLALCATNGQRIAAIERQISCNSDIQIIIPIKTVAEIQSNLTKQGVTSIVIAENQALFDFGNTQIISRLVEGQFPDYTAVIPAVAEKKAKINRSRFLEAMKRSALLATPDFVASKLEFKKDLLIISKRTPDVGESEEEIVIEYSGEDIVTGFKPEYLVDVLKVLKDEIIEFEVVDAKKPGVIRIKDYIYIALPLRVE